MAPETPMTEDVTCPGCGARWEPTGTDAPPSVAASAECWATFGEVLAREFQDPSYGHVHRHTVDVYQAQHPGSGDRVHRQSVALNLIALCRWLEHGDPIPKINHDTQRLAGERRGWPWLEPPTAYGMTARDLLAAQDGMEHGRLVRRWAVATWEAWSAHHETIRRWAAELGP